MESLFIIFLVFNSLCWISSCIWSVLILWIVYFNFLFCGGTLQPCEVVFLSLLGSLGCSYGPLSPQSCHRHRGVLGPWVCASKCWLLSYPSTAFQPLENDRSAFLTLQAPEKCHHLPFLFSLPVIPGQGCARGWDHTSGLWFLLSLLLSTISSPVLPSRLCK